MLTIHKDMPTYTLKNLSPELHHALQNAAKTNKRSINSEILECLETTYMSNKKSKVQALLARLESLNTENESTISIEQIVNDVREARQR